jgi:carboxymethylenebutenolidase
MDFQPGSKTPSGYLALPSSGKGAGILILHAWWGLNGFFVELCERLAREGFVVLAPDLYEGAIASSVEEAQQLLEGIDPEATQGRVLLAQDSLRQHPAVRGQKTGVLGCSMGAYWALLLSTLRPEEVAAAVIFYGVVEGVDFTAARSAYLGHFAENDLWDPVEQARMMEADMRAAGREVAFYVYPGVGHWFFEENQPEAYHAECARLAWDRTVSFLHDRLQRTTGQKDEG